MHRTKVPGTWPTPAHLTGHSWGTVHKEGKQMSLRGGGEKGPKVKMGDIFISFVSCCYFSQVSFIANLYEKCFFYQNDFQTSE